MPSEKPNTVLILGSSALKIGEAGEFDYSGSQAIKALKEEGIRTILINPNIATIQTSEQLADEVYFLPITPDFVERVIERERPDGLLLSFGGQTALNCGLRLDESGVLAKHNIKVLGTPVRAIRDTEDRDLFVKRLNEIDAKAPRSRAATSVSEAIEVARELGFPVMVRVGFALGGLGSGLCRDEAALRLLAGKGLAHTHQILVEEYLEGWKEIEYEVVRDQFDNCITVCNMENFDPLGIHTGESIVVCPSQTLTNHEYHKLRAIAIKVIRHLGIVGECNIQYALDPNSDDYRIIEVNARLSRSSALASKATGYPLAFVAAKLALGYGLHELPNAITKVTKAFFEPAIDYCVVKIPRWDLGKFRNVSRRIGSGMKSVGEVMAIGRTFGEAIQKAIRMLDIGRYGLVANEPADAVADKDLEREIAQPTEERIFYVIDALERGWSVDRVHTLSHIDEWFLDKLEHIVHIASKLRDLKRSDPDLLEEPLLREAKVRGYSDEQIARLTGLSAEGIRKRRVELSISPVVRQIDTMAAEYPAQTNYLYLTYSGDRDDVDLPVDNAVLLLGSGVYRIGCSVEFDWCCVNAGYTLRELGYRTVMLNYNPETVSTDYDEFDQLFFDEISFESVLEICEKVKPIGVVVSMGGQISNNLAMRLHNAGIRILGTSAQSIDNAENRHKFSSMLDRLDIDQPEWAELAGLDDARAFAVKVGYPVLVRPSYVLSGAAMAVVSNDEELSTYLKQAARVSREFPTVISKFLENAKEIEYDAVAQDGEIVVYAISEHVENAGVHSGDATLVFPPQRTYQETIRQVRLIARKIARDLNINGPFNIQFIAKDNSVKVIECNLRASRSFPFVSKVLRQNFIEYATKVIVGQRVPKPDTSVFELNHVGVKAAQFSFSRLDGADPTLGVEMASTGEVGCLGDDFHEALLKAMLSVGYRLPIRSVLLSLGPIESKAELLPSVQRLADSGIILYTSKGTAAFLENAGIQTKVLEWPLDETSPNCLEVIHERKVDLVINIPKNDRPDELTNGYKIRRAAVDYNIPLITNRQIAARFIEAFSRTSVQDLAVKPWSAYTQT
ncbi:MAG: carbamoyl-phosphate synthase (glutamine-hydrolyzing) large subunit [Phycisphaeraceae bacterium]|nr:MAG: carbamoyl-phosphate synthase (glutamine-hydrolyzing) large subunit [Phycisphaeraceae bacterium]